MTFELSLLLKTTVLLSAGLVAVRCARRTRASRRHVMLACTFAALAGLPVAETFGPTISVSLPVSRTQRLPPVVMPVAAVAGPTAVAPGHDAVPYAPTPSSSWPSTTMMVRGLWAIGAAGALTALVFSLARLRGIRRSGVPWIAGQTIADAMARKTGIRRPVTLLLHQRIAAPATIGVLRPSILLPPDAPQWSDADLRRAFVHELEHVRRGDAWIHLAAHAICGVYWFHPLAWIAWRQLAIEAERACDDAVVGGMDRTVYADQLVALAARMSPLHSRRLLSMANGSDLSVRVRAILNPRQRRGRPGVVAVASIVAVVATSVGMVGSLRAVAPPRDVSASGIQESRTIEAVTQVRETAPPAPAPQAPIPIRAAVAPPKAQVPAATPPVSAVVAPEEYLIGPDDVLSVTFLHDQALSPEILVRPDGKITLPIIGDIAAAGATVDQLRARIATEARQFMKTPQVTVAVRAINSRKVFLTGEVKKPGMYLLTGPMTVLQLIATAGGLGDFAKRERIFVLRTVDGKSVRFPFNYTALLAGYALHQNIVLRPGDTVVVP